MKQRALLAGLLLATAATVHAQPVAPVQAQAKANYADLGMKLVVDTTAEGGGTDAAFAARMIMDFSQGKVAPK